MPVISLSMRAIHCSARLLRSPTHKAAHWCLGIAETEGNPPRADAINPIVRAHDLAAQLADVARACIDPPLGSLQVRGIETEEGTGAGVIVLGTAASPAGPQPIANDGHAFIRRGTSSVKMTMREIQNLTIDLSRGFERLDVIFRDTASEFLEWNSHPTFSGTDGAMRITAAPFGRLPLIPSVAHRAAEFLISGQTTVRFENNSRVIELAAPLKNAESRPILRGLRLSDVRGIYGTRVDVFDNGMTNLRFRASSALRAGQLVLSEVLNGSLLVLRIAEWFRRQAETPEWEYALELELATPGLQLRIQTFDDEPLDVILLDKRVVFPRLVSRSSR